MSSSNKDFFRYVLPSMLAFAMSGVYAIADGFFVGNALGDSALAAINVAYPLTAFLQAVGTGIGMGGAIQYAISVGAGKRRRAQRYFGMALLLLTGLGVLLTVVFALGAPAMLRLLGASGEIDQLAREYILYISFGAVFQVLGTGIVPFLRNMGGSVAAMGSMIAGFLTNILLDYLFVWRLPWGMMGAAVATVLGQMVTFLVCLAYLAWKKRKPSFRFGRGGLFLMGRIFRVGASPFGLTFSPNLTLILVNRCAAGFGAAAVTCYAPISYISCVTLLLLQGISDGVQPLLSLAHGEGDRERAKTQRGNAYRFSLVVGVACMGGLYLLRGSAASLFGASQEIALQVAQILPVFLCGYPFVAVARVTTAYCYATGRNLQAYLLIYGEPVFLALLLLALPQMAGLAGVWLSVPLSQILAMVLSVILLFRERPTSSRIRWSGNSSAERE